MTPIALCYLVIGAVALLWPLETLLFKRTVMVSQWLLMASMAMYGISTVLYSCLFNGFLNREYLLVMLYMVSSLLVMPMVHVSMSSMTSVGGVTPRSRKMFLPSLAMLAILGLTLLIGGGDMYRLWIARGADGLASHYYANSWRYNLIVFSHYWLFYIVLVAEVIVEIVYGIYRLYRFSTLLTEYYPSDIHRLKTIKSLNVIVTVYGVATMVGLAIYPFNTYRPVWVAVVSCGVAVPLLIAIGIYIRTLSYGAETLGYKLQHAPKAKRNDLKHIRHQLTETIEREGGYRNPDISVFALAEQLHVSQDDVVDAIHQSYGCSFGSYIDSLRVAQAINMLSGSEVNLDDAEQLEHMAHACGYLSVETLEKAFLRTMQTTLRQWYADNVRDASTAGA